MDQDEPFDTLMPFVENCKLLIAIIREHSPTIVDSEKSANVLGLSLHSFFACVRTVSATPKSEKGMSS